MQDIRLIALDLDGTALTTGKQLSPRTAAALSAALARGVQVVPATGRTAEGVPEAFLRLPGVAYILASNGATVLERATGRHLVELPFPAQQALAIYDAVERYDGLMSIFMGGRAYSLQRDYARIDLYTPPELRAYIRQGRTYVADMRAALQAHADCIEKFSILYRDMAVRDAAEAAVRARWPGVEATHSLGCNLELNAPGVNKGRGLAELARVLGLAPAQVMVCGDSGNDLSMIEYAGLGVAMGNADDTIKAAAQYVTLDNDHDGVAAAVEKFVLC